MERDLEAQFEHFTALIGRHFIRLETQIRDGFRDVGDHLQRLDARMAVLEGRLDALETRVSEGLLTVSDQLTTTNLRIDELDARLTARISETEFRITTLWYQVRDRQASAEARTDALALTVDALSKTVDALRERVDAAAEERRQLGKELLSRLEVVEQHLLRLTNRVDGLSEDVLQRFRVVNDRLGEIDRRLAA